ncbi:FtsX-like permease family protein [Candidatus Pacearchaeota archaeon]|nr:FtsX-like permease family protein [Candidatus Pacearchaeota archaeon]MBD3283196.1 FtsX-like permease family protein [Candidatus Pacearchaeota archaeon]
MLKDFFLLSLNNLKRRRLRSWLTMIGIFIGIAAVVSLISLGQGLQNAITGQFETLSTDKLTIQNSGTGFGPPGSTVIEKLTEHDLRVIERVRGVEIAVPRLVRVVKLEYNDAASFNYVGDIPQEKEKMELVYSAMNMEAEEGRLLKPSDLGKVVIGSNIAKETTFDKEVELGKSIVIQGQEFEVLGILKRGSSFQVNDIVVMLNDDVKELLEIDDEIDIIIAQIEKNEDIEEVAARVERAMRKDRGLDEGEEDFSVQTPLQSLEVVNQVLGTINAIVVGIAFISLLVGGIGVANTMYTAVLERRKEIGTMKAIGAKNSDVLLIFLIESGLLGLVGGIIGILIGEGLAFGLSSAANSYFGNQIISVDLSIPLNLSVLTFSFLLGVLFGAIPSYQASKLRPAEALRG